MVQRIPPGAEDDHQASDDHRPGVAPTCVDQAVQDALHQGGTRTAVAPDRGPPRRWCDGPGLVTRGAAAAHSSTPPERLLILFSGAGFNAGTPPLERTWRKADRCTATRPTAPSVNTSMA